MPSQIFVSKEQIKQLKKLDADVVVVETHLIANALDFWVLDENSHDGQHRSVVIEQDGTVISDAIVSDAV
jgi:hypothetical protein